MTPSLTHNAFGQPIDPTLAYYDDWSLDGGATYLPAQYAFADAAALDDEHKLIARYSAKLSGRTNVHYVLASLHPHILYQQPL